MAPRVGLEPTTSRLTAVRSTDWANEEYKKLATPYFPGAHARVSSASKGLTAVFGMGTGVPPSSSSPICYSIFISEHTQKYII